MSKGKLNIFLSASLKSGVAILPLAIAFAQMPASAQPKTQAQLEAEAAAARAAAASGADADDAEAAAVLFGGLTGTSKSTENSKDIVVTGTNIRGVAPTGTNLSVLTREDIAATGQSSMQQLLTQIPGMGTFLDIPQLPSGAAAAAANTLRPNLRSTPDGDNGPLGLGDPGASTLILIDGNRQSGGGIRSVATDPESISPSLLERVEINTDGAGAAYGSDAIGGVINFVTRRKYDGVEMGGRLSYADDYWAYDGNFIAGKDWGSGSAYIAGSYAHNTALLNGDRDFYKVIDWATGLQTGLNCDLPNISIAATAATGSGTAFVPAIPTHYYRVNADGSIARSGDVITNDVRTTKGTGTPVGGLATSLPAAGLPTDSSRPNLCTLGARNYRVVPATRYNAALNFYQQITDDIDLIVRGNYSIVDSLGRQPAPTANIAVGANNPWRQELRAGADGTGTTQATYPTTQPGFTTPQNDVIRGTTPVAQTVLTNYANAYGLDAFYSHNRVKKFGGNFQVNWRIDGNWAFRLDGLYDRTRTEHDYRSTGIFTPYLDGLAGGQCTVATAAFVAAGGNTAASQSNAAALAARAAARQVCINPYDIEGSNPAILADAINYDNKALANNAIIDFKANLDGALFELPGGKVRVAVGGEYTIDEWEKWNYVQTLSRRPISFKAMEQGLGDESLTVVADRVVWAVYGEANIPLVSRANELTWIKELRISFGGRYDHYTKFGGSFTPKVGASFKPLNWLTIRGNWNKSYRAPPIIAQAGTIFIDPVIGSQVPFGQTNPLVAMDGSQVVWSLSGSSPNLRPQTGKQWSVGFEVTPFRGFRASATYSYIDFIDELGQPNPFQTAGQRGIGQGCLPESPFVVILDPRAPDPGRCTTSVPAGPPLTPAQVQAAKDAFLSGADNEDEVRADGREVYGLYSTIFRNVGDSKIGNFDYRASYNSRTPWGSVFFSASGSVKLINKRSVRDAAGNLTGEFVPYNALSRTAPRSRHSMTAQAGFVYGPLRASATLLHADGFRVTRTATFQQDRIADFNVINTTATWNFKGDNVIERGLELTLNISNILNASPPLRMSGTGTDNGSTLGRVVQVGILKKF